MTNVEQMKLFLKANNALRLIENGAIAYGKAFDATMETIKANGLEEKFWQYAAKH